MRWPAVALCLASAATAHADATVTVMLNDEGRALAGRLGLSVPDLIATAEARIDELYRVSRIDNLLRAFGDTAAFSQRGLGVDYDVDPGDIFVGLAAAGVNGDVAVGTTNKLAGSVLNLSVLTGANLARWGQPRLTVFANGFYRETEVRGLLGHLFTLGAHAQ